MVSYPGSLPASDAQTAGYDHARVYAEVLAALTELGTIPSGPLYSTVKARLRSVDQGLIKPAHAGLKAWNFFPGMASQRQAPTTGQAWSVLVPVSDGDTISNVHFNIGLSGSGFTSGQCFVAVYSGNGGTKLGQTADLASTITSTGNYQVALASPFAFDGSTYDYCRVCFIIAASTMPQIACASPQNNMANPLTTGLLAGRDGNTTYTTPPSSIGYGTNTGQILWAGLS